MVDDHQLIIDGITSFLKDDPEWDLIGYANDGEEAVRKIPTLRPDMVLMDLDMPKMNGLMASEKILKEIPYLKIVILTLHYERAIVEKLIKMGISGYILKNSPREELIKGLEMIRSGTKFYSSMVMESVLEVSSIASSKETNVKMMALLSEREREVLDHIAQGRSTREMSESMNLSPKTLETYRKNLLDKLGARNSADLIRIAIKNGLLEL